MKRTRPTKPAAKTTRVTLKDIAKTAGVSLMTVSYAMRGSSEVSEKQRKRVQAIAEKLGYRPDPLLAHLMSHLRGSRRTPKTSVNLALLMMWEPPFVSRLIAGAAQRANKLGYALDRIDLRTETNTEALTRTLMARGVAGVVLAPLLDPGVYRDLLDWNQFAATAMTYSLTKLSVNRVVTHHFENAVRTFALLCERGYKRIGLAMTPDMEFRANHSYSGAYFRLTPMDGQATFPVLMLEGDIQRAVTRWFARYRPDAVVLANSNHFNDSIRPFISPAILRKTAFVSLDSDPTHGVAGIDQMFEVVGSQCVDDVVAQILRNERGFRPSPTVTMIEGKWAEATGLFPGIR